MTILKGVRTRLTGFTILSIGALTAVLGVAQQAASNEVIFAEAQRSQKTQIGYRENSGALADGTRYLIRVPEGWNGILIRDLDYADRVGQTERLSRYEHLLSEGYALSGTARHPLRAWQYDPAREIANLDQVLNLFEQSFGDPRHVIQFGCSGGGHVALAVAEDFHERIDGSVVLSAHTPVWLMNTFLDGWFALQTLLQEYYVAAGIGPATDLAIIDLPNDGSAAGDGHGMKGDLPEAWRRAFEAAYASPEGRARMVLAFTLAQWHPWLADGDARPAYDDVESIEKAVYDSLLRLAGSPGGEARIIFENAAQGQQLSWTENVDYAAFFENSNGGMRSVVEKLYADTGLDIQDDIARINAAKGVLASPHAIEYWGQPGRTVMGDPEIPVFRLHGLGDYQIPYTLMLGYQQAVEKNGKGDMLRSALVESTSHCTESAISTAESSAAIEVMVQRLENGQWPDTGAEQLNELARSLHNSRARFIETGTHDIASFNRFWVPEGREP